MKSGSDHREPLRTYDINLHFDGVLEPIIASVRTRDVDAEIETLRRYAETRNGYKFRASVATERVFGHVTYLDKVTLQCPHCNATMAVYDYDKIDVDPLDHVPFSCRFCNKVFYMKRILR